MVEVGPNATNFKVGDTAGIAWLHFACGVCEYCVSGWETLCERQQNSGYSVDGAYSDYAIAADSHAIRIPDGMDPFQAARKYLLKLVEVESHLFLFHFSCSVCWSDFVQSFEAYRD